MEKRWTFVKMTRKAGSLCTIEMLFLIERYVFLRGSYLLHLLMAILSKG